jgi:ABC-type antimicrobial peptide transport system permease subunit
VVGVFEANGSGFESEIWGDVEQLMQAFRRPAFSSVTLRLNDPANFDALKTRLEADPRLTIEVEREKRYYAKQSEIMANFIRILGTFVTIIFSLGAIVGAAITMYAAVANRTVEIGTMRALGFARRSVLAAFLVESLFLALIGGGLGMVVASFMQFITVSTTNWGTFSELAFSFTLSPDIVMQGLIFSLFMGLIGGFFPAVRAARLNILSALRAS